MAENNIHKFDLSIVIVSFNTKDLTLECIESVIKNTKGITYEIIVVDNASSDKSVEALKKLKDKITLLTNTNNIGFAAANNQGSAQAKGRYVLFLNSDTRIDTNILGEMINWMNENQKVGILGCKIVGTDGETQEAGGYFPTLLRVFSWMTVQDFPLVDTLIKPFHPLKKKSLVPGNSFFDKKQDLDWIIGAFILIRQEILKSIGGWDQDYFMYTEDVDLCYRTKKQGWKIIYNPAWQILHYGGASSKTREYPLVSEFKGIKKFYQKHYPSWQYPLVLLFLRIGALGRMLIFGILEGKESMQIYAKAFKQI